ncbi:P-type cation-transporting ATPase [Chloropicon primus]|nr:P-type cation-transporting ATPase [Chloropicon primus]
MAKKNEPSPSAEGEKATMTTMASSRVGSGRNSIALDPPPQESVRAAAPKDMMKSLAAEAEDDEVSTIEAYDDGRTEEEILEGFTTEEAQKKLDKYGYNEVLTVEEPEWKKIVSRFLGIVPICMIVGAIISAAVETGCVIVQNDVVDCACDPGRDWVSFALLIFEVVLIVYVDYRSEKNAADAVKALKEMSAPTCRAKRDGEWVETPVRELVPGDLIELAAGVVVPSDGKLVGHGEPMLIDESSLTGESLPVTKHPGDEVLSGAVVVQGELEMMVTATGVDTFFGKTIALLATVTEQGNVQHLLGTVAKIMCTLGLVGVIPIFFVQLFRDDVEWASSLKTAIVILVATLPVAMPLVVTTALAVGSYELSQEKAIVQRLSAIEEMAGMDILCSDKTGTLTKNELVLDKELIWQVNDSSAGEILRVACLAAKIEGGQDAIDRAVTEALESFPESEGGGLEQLKGYKVTKFVPFNPVDKRTEATVIAPDGKTYRMSKGAPGVMVDLCCEGELKVEAEDKIIENAQRGLRSLGVAIADGDETSEEEYKLIGMISLLDPPRDDTEQTIIDAQNKGVEVKMITGDQKAIAIETASRLNMGTNIIGSEIWGPDGEALIRAQGSFGTFIEQVNGFASVFPEHKFRIVEELQKIGHICGMTGDGVNDAPALKRANVGIAVAGATDAAKSASDIVLNAPGLSTIITAINRSRKIFNRLNGYVLYRMASSVLILGFFFLSIVALQFDFPTWVLILLSLVNDFTAMATSKDSCRPAEEPLKWNMVHTTIISVVIGLVGVLENILLLWLSDPRYVSWWSGWGLEELSSCQVVAVMYLNIAMTVQLNIFSTRNKYFYFITSERLGGAPLPSITLCIPVFFSILIAVLIAALWPENISLGGGANMVGCGWAPVGIVALWALVWFHVRDAIKVLTYKVMESGSDMFYANLTGTSKEERRKAVKDMIKKARKRLGLKAYQKEGLKNQIESHQIPHYDKVGEIHAKTPRMSVDESAAKVREVMSKIKALETEMRKLTKRVDALEGEGPEASPSGKKKRGLFRRGGGGG